MGGNFWGMHTGKRTYVPIETSFLTDYATLVSGCLLQNILESLTVCNTGSTVPLQTVGLLSLSARDVQTQKYLAVDPEHPDLCLKQHTDCKCEDDKMTSLTALLFGNPTFMHVLCTALPDHICRSCQSQTTQCSMHDTHALCIMQKDQSFTIRARPRGYHAPLHLLQFETTRGRDISDLIIAITNKWLLM